MNCGKKFMVSWLTKYPECDCGQKTDGYGWHVRAVNTDGAVLPTHNYIYQKTRSRSLASAGVVDLGYTHNAATIRFDQKAKKTVRVEVVDEETFNIYGITQKVDIKEEKKTIVVSDILSWIASYSWKDGATARRVYGKEKTKDVSFADLMLEFTSLSSYEDFRSDPRYFLGSKNASQFILDHSEFLTKIGFIDYLRLHNHAPNESRNQVENDLIKYITLIGEYPVFEQIIKAGHSNLAAAILRSVQYASKEGIREILAEWKKILDIDSSSGAKALKLPRYVSSFLAASNATIEDYRFWIKNWDYFGLSKEQFEEFVGDTEYVIAKVEDLFNYDYLELLKRGYNPQKLKRYLVKQCYRKSGHLLVDYLDMAEDCGIEPDPYPYQLIKMHDDIADIAGKLSSVYDESYVKRIQSEARDLVAKSRQFLEDKSRFPADFKDYLVLFPTEKQEFFNEGNAMHSCVGPYMKNVNAGNNIVFFVRKKDEPGESYVTAEWDKNAGGVGQILMSNNRECSDPKAQAFATWIADTIQLGIDRKLINL